MVSYLPIYQITKNIFICDRQKSVDLTVLEEYKINGMLYMSSEVRPVNILEDYRELKIDHYHIPIIDDGSPDIDIEPHFNQIVRIIRHYDTNGGKILVYCDTGIRLSPVAVIVYLLYKVFMIYDRETSQEGVTLALINGVQGLNRDIDWHRMEKIVQQLVMYEITLREKKKYNDKLKRENTTKMTEIFDS